jgi:tRNA pseudouridine38-40 synthase
MKRFFFEMAYNGSSYFGWQRQPKHVSVQEVVEQALSKLQSNTEVHITGCGRTDTGVHAAQYFFHVDLPEAPLPFQEWMYKLNSILPDNLAISSIKEVSTELHARFSAQRRTYRYFIHWQKDPFLSDRSLFLRHQPNFTTMNEASTHLLGKQDFTSLSKLHTDVKTNICNVSHAQWVQTSDSTAYFEISADRFLRNMVRATVGTLLEVGTGKLFPKDLIHILAAKDRGEASVSVPAHALFLWKVEY